MDKLMRETALRMSMMPEFYKEFMLQKGLYIVESIKKCEVENKLRGKDRLVDEATLVKKAWPGHVGFAAHALEKEQNILNALNRNGIIFIVNRSQPPYQYNINTLYTLTDYTRDLIIEKNYGELMQLILRAVVNEPI